MLNIQVEPAICMKTKTDVKNGLRKMRFSTGENADLASQFRAIRGPVAGHVELSTLPVKGEYGESTWPTRHVRRRPRISYACQSTSIHDTREMQSGILTCMV